MSSNDLEAWLRAELAEGLQQRLWSEKGKVLPPLDRAAQGCCSNCGGAGTTYTGEPCSDCYGTGHCHVGPCESGG